MSDTVETVEANAPTATPVATGTEAETKTTTVVVEQKTPDQIEADQEAKAAQQLEADQQKALDRVRAEKAKKEGAAPAPKEQVETAPKDAKAESKDEPKRGEDGKFLPKDGKPKEPEAKDAKDAKPGMGHNQPPEPTEVEKPKLPPPASFSKVTKEKWDKLDPEVQADLADYERKVAQGSSRLANEAQRYKAAVEQALPVMQVAHEFSDTLRSWKMNEADAFRNLMKNADHLHKNPIDEIDRLADGYKVKEALLAKWMGQDPGTFDPAPEVKAHVSALERELIQTKNLLEAERAQFAEVMQYRQYQEQSAAVSAIRTGVVDKFAQGREHFDAVADDVAAYLPVAMQKFPQDRDKALDHAYRLAIAGNETIQKAMQDKAAKEAEQKRLAEQEAKAKAARAASLLNAPGNASFAGPDDDLESIQAAALQRARANKSARATMI